MKYLHSIIMTFSMYSRIPMPQIEWKEENRAYAMCFFPLVGVVIGLLCALWLLIAEELRLTKMIVSAVLVALPILLSGGIHMDGFCDVTDALASHQPREKKLAILKDSHCGAFAVIHCCIYLLLFFAVWFELGISKWNVAFAVLLIPVVSRAMSGLAAVSFPNARGSGMLASFVDETHLSTVRGVMVCWLALLLAGQIALSPLTGGFAFLFAVLSFIYYRIMAFRSFGGITGDLAGWFLQVCELCALIGALLGQRLGVVL